MNTKYTRLLLLGVLYFSLGNLPAQNSNFQARQVAYKENVNKAESPQNRYAYLGKISSLYTGYAIEIATSELPLTRDYATFQNFGKVYYDKVGGNYYSYVILADFNKAETAQEYLSKMISHKVENAKIVRYKNGQRKENKPKKFYRMVD